MFVFGHVLSFCATLESDLAVRAHSKIPCLSGNIYAHDNHLVFFLKDFCIHDYIIYLKDSNNAT
jgi:hypothetical protein